MQGIFDSDYPMTDHEWKCKSNHHSWLDHLMVRKIPYSRVDLNLLPFCANEIIVHCELTVKPSPRIFAACVVWQTNVLLARSCIHEMSPWHIFSTLNVFEEYNLSHTQRHTLIFLHTNILPQLSIFVQIKVSDRRNRQRRTAVLIIQPFYGSVLQVLVNLPPWFMLALGYYKWEVFCVRDLITFGTPLFSMAIIVNLIYYHLKMVIEIIIRISEARKPNWKLSSKWARITPFHICLQKIPAPASPPPSLIC